MQDPARPDLASLSERLKADNCRVGQVVQSLTDRVVHPGPATILAPPDEPAVPTVTITPPHIPVPRRSLVRLIGICGAARNRETPADECPLGN
jgi:hypothetical protein